MYIYISCVFLFALLQDPFSGIIPRTLSHLFDELRIQEVECTVRVSFIEIYNEDIYDLLSATDDTTKLRLVFLPFCILCVTSCMTCV